MVCVYMKGALQEFINLPDTSCKWTVKLSILLPVLPLGHEADGVFMIQLPN